MNIICSPKRSGKTTKLIERASKGEYKIIVCHSLEEASRIFKVALEMKKKIAMPISYREFVEGRYYGKNIEAFLIDNVDQLIVYMAKGVTVEAITISHH